MVHKIILNVYQIHHKRLSELKRLSAYISERYRDSTSLGPVVNILAIFSNANILKNKRIKIYHIKGIGCPLLISIFDQGTEK